jgi:hypothetical protein
MEQENQRDADQAERPAGGPPCIQGPHRDEKGEQTARLVATDPAGRETISAGMCARHLKIVADRWNRSGHTNVRMVSLEYLAEFQTQKVAELSERVRAEEIRQLGADPYADAERRAEAREHDREGLPPVPVAQPGDVPARVRGGGGVIEHWTKTRWRADHTVTVNDPEATVVTGSRVHPVAYRIGQVDVAWEWSAGDHFPDLPRMVVLWTTHTRTGHLDGGRLFLGQIRETPEWLASILTRSRAAAEVNYS